MKLQSKIIGSINNKTNEYPCLMICHNPENADYIVLFCSPGNGTVVWANENSKYKSGEYGHGWHMPSFKLYYGVIELRNVNI